MSEIGPELFGQVELDQETKDRIHNIGLRGKIAGAQEFVKYMNTALAAVESGYLNVRDLEVLLTDTADQYELLLRRKMK